MSVEQYNYIPDNDGERQDRLYSNDTKGYYPEIASRTGKYLQALAKGEPIDKDEAFSFLHIYAQSYLREAFFGAPLIYNQDLIPGTSAVREAAEHAQRTYEVMATEYKNSNNPIYRSALSEKMPKNPYQLMTRMHEASVVLLGITDGKINPQQFNPYNWKIIRTMMFFRTAFENDFTLKLPSSVEEPGSRFVSPEKAAFYNRLLTGVHANPEKTKEQDLADEKAELKRQKEEQRLKNWLSDIDVTVLPDYLTKHNKELEFIRRITKDITMYPVILYKPARPPVTLPGSYYERYGLEKPITQKEVDERSRKLIEEEDLIIDFRRVIPNAEEVELYIVSLLEDMKEKAEEDAIRARAHRILEHSGVIVDFAKRIPTKEEEKIEQLLKDVNISDEL